jgi:molybdopterin-guanine dinucleotide biosynthesis protein A
MELEPFAAIVLAGGRGSRLGGVHKPGLRIGGATLLDRVLAAATGATARIVVGPPQPVPPGVTVLREDPPGGGPVAALAAGLSAVREPLVAVLAGDLPFLTAEAVTALRRSAVGRDGAVLADADGKDQYLASVWRAEPLRAAVAALGDLRNASMRRVLAELAYARVLVPGEPGGPGPWFDCDDPVDLTVARRWVAPHMSKLDDWIAAVALELDLPGLIDRDLLLDVARDVAHGVARPAAPITTYLLGLAVGAGANADEAAAKIRALAEGFAPDSEPDPATEI